MPKQIKSLLISALVVGCASGILSIILLASGAAQPQPMIDLSRGEWLVFQFDNGSQWYMKDGSVNAIHGIPADEAKKLGYKTVIYGNGFKINCPMTVSEINQRLNEIEIQRLKGRITP